MLRRRTDYVNLMFKKFFFHLKFAKRMKILFVGVIDVPSSSNTSMAKELRNLGHHVIDFNYRTIRLFSTPFWLKLLCYSLNDVHYYHYSVQSEILICLYSFDNCLPFY